MTKDLKCELCPDYEMKNDDRKGCLIVDANAKCTDMRYYMDKDLSCKQCSDYKKADITKIKCELVDPMV